MLYLSGRSFQHQLGEHWVWYEPDRVGFPVVLDGFAYELARRFAGGATVPDVVGALTSATAETQQDILTLIDALQSLGALRNEPTAERYEPLDLTAAGPVSSLNVWLHVTNDCNLDCHYCYVDKSRSPMSRDTLDRVVEQILQTVRVRGLRSVGVSFAGGEPTLVMDTIRRCQERLAGALDAEGVKLDSAILSNGTVVSDELVAFLKGSGVRLSVSLDGHGEGQDAHRVFRNGRGSWSAVSANVDWLISKNVRPSILATVSPESAATLPALMRWVFERGLGMALGAVRRPLDTPTGRRPDAAAYKVLCSHLNRAFDEAFAEAARPEHHIDLADGLRITELDIEQPKWGGHCGTGRNYTAINQRGELAGCSMALSDGTVPGSSDLVATLQHHFGIQRSAQLQRINAPCLACRWYPVCRGGCPKMTLDAELSEGDLPPFHDFYDHVIPRYVVLCGEKILQAARKGGVQSFRMLRHPPSQRV